MGYQQYTLLEKFKNICYIWYNSNNLNTTTTNNNNKRTESDKNFKFG